MSRENLIKQRIYDSWIPRIKKRIKAGEKSGKIFNNISEAKLKKIAEMADVRFRSLQRPKLITESTATLDGTPGRPNFDFGNNPMQGLQDFYTTKGSAEVYQSLFGVFVEAAATTVIFDLLPMLVQTKSSGSIYIAEPIYSNGRLESTENRVDVVQVKTSQTGNPAALVVGNTYTLKTAATGGEDIADVIYVGKHRVSGHPVFRIETNGNDNSGGGGTDWTSALIKDWFDGTSGIYDDASNYYSFDADSVDYVEGFLNNIMGFSGAGLNNDKPWYIGRNDGKTYNEHMSRDTGRRTEYRSSAIRTWHRNFSPGTVHLDMEFLTEDIQDAMMDHSFDLIAFGDQILADQLSQQMNDHGLARMFANGWSHHHALHTGSDGSFNLNFVLDESSNTGSSLDYLGKEDTLLNISGAAGVLPASGAISENLSTLQRRLVTRIGYASSVIHTRARKGKGDQVVMNTKFGNAVEDIRGFVPVPFDNDLNDGNLAYIGTFKGMRAYVDPLMDLNDDRINVSRHGGEKDPGIKFAPYILAEKISTTAEGTMAEKTALKSRYSVVEAGSNPELNYLTFVVEEADGYGLV